MSKYNLTDILEQYRIGSGWTTDFDYDGMLKTGLGTSIDTPIEVLKKMSDDFEDVNYHRENSHLQDAIDAIEIGDMMEAEGRLSDFHAEIKKTQEDQGMDIEPTLGKFMDAKMEEKEEKKLPMDENTEAVDLAIEASQEKAGVKEDKDKEPRDGVKSAASKLGMKPSHVKEVRIDRDVAERIESFLSISMKAKFLDAWEDLFYDLVDDEPFYVEDVVNHLNNEMHKRIKGNQMAGDKLAGLDEEDAIEDEPVTEDSIEEALPKFKGVPPMKDIVKALKNDAKATDSEIKQFMSSVKKAGDEFDDVDDYVEDFKNYVADKSLQEHFGRFMKDYQ
jgi:hypothetical protein